MDDGNETDNYHSNIGFQLHQLCELLHYIINESKLNAQQVYIASYIQLFYAFIYACIYIHAQYICVYVLYNAPSTLSRLQTCTPPEPKNFPTSH